MGFSPQFSVYLRPVDVARNRGRGGVANAAPIRGIMAGPDEAVEARPGPGMGAGCEAVFDGVVVDVLDAADAVALGADEVFPETFLPDIAVTLPLPRDRLGRFRAAGREVVAGEAGFDG